MLIIKKQYIISYHSKKYNNVHQIIETHIENVAYELADVMVTDKYGSWRIGEPKRYPPFYVRRKWPYKNSIGRASGTQTYLRRIHQRLARFLHTAVSGFEQESEQ